MISANAIVEALTVVGCCTEALQADTRTTNAFRYKFRNWWSAPQDDDFDGGIYEAFFEWLICDPQRIRAMVYGTPDEVVKAYRCRNFGAKSAQLYCDERDRLIRERLEVSDV